ncbi:radical SAM protein [Polyangium sp. 6x1]|uniref:radical SAM protein n=1 Tax=Polyangium sp. 6x1 TaxID=3042689 RepID=UPI00248320B5|nr:radical SAM protein [Polyangium sp. 6x1]MDI1450531.1 radical SAM protein [Polyangium sp. 6x1]
MSTNETALARPEASGMEMALVPLRLGGFSCKAILLEGDDRLTARFEAKGSADWVEVTVLPHGAPGPVFRRLARSAVRYRGAIAERTPERREEVSRLVMAVAASIDALLERSPGKTIAEALGRSRERGRLLFGRDGLRALLSPEIVEGAPAAAGFSLVDVYPSSYLQKSHDGGLELVLDFRRESDARRLLLLVGRRDDTKPAFATTAHFSIKHLSLAAADPVGADELRALVAFVLQLRDHEGLDVVFPDILSDVAPALLLPSAPEEAEPSADSEVLNLAIDADCEQSCAFCSIKETAPAEDGGDRVLARLFADLESNRRRGVRAVRINGYDPLAHSRILDVLRRAKDLGYRAAHVFSPCTRLADPAFCDDVVAALPEDKRFHVPLYSVSPEAHDRIVGRRGAHALVARALENLLARVSPDAVWILSVATREGTGELEGVARFAAERGLSFFPHMPYPSFESRADRYFSSAPRMSDVAEVMSRALARGARMNVQGVVPCVVFRRMHEHGLPPRAWLDAPAERPPLPGTEYRDPRFRHRAGEAEHAAFHASAIRCPHEARCVLASACPGEVLRSYAEIHGLSELSPVSLRELVEAT